MIQDNTTAQHDTTTQGTKPPFDGAAAVEFARRFEMMVEYVTTTMNDAGGESFKEWLGEALGTDPTEIPLQSRGYAAFRLPDIDAALLALAGEGAREFGVVSNDGSLAYTTTADWLQRPQSVRVGKPMFANMPVGPDESRMVMSLGGRVFTHQGVPVVALQRGADPQYGRREASVDLLCPDPKLGERLFKDIDRLMNERSALRGKVFTLDGDQFGQTAFGVTFHERPEVPADAVILPPGILDRIHRHVIGIGEQREALRRVGQHLKRGLLMFGPPGTGKTHTIRHLVGQSPESTVIMLTGNSLQHVTVAAQWARALAPSLVVIEDCDLIAEDRSMSSGSPQPLLFEVLDALDGLANDADVAFILTTNRAETLEPALAQRPGRIDLAVEVPLPDDAQREALFKLYARETGLGEKALEEAATRCAGTTASFAKELIRRAVLRAALDGREVRDRDLLDAVDEMMLDREALTRKVLGDSGSQPEVRLVDSGFNTFHC